MSSSSSSTGGANGSSPFSGYYPTLVDPSSRGTKRKGNPNDDRSAGREENKREDGRLFNKKLGPVFYGSEEETDEEDFRESEIREAALSAVANKSLRELSQTLPNKSTSPQTMATRTDHYVPHPMYSYEQAKNSEAADLFFKGNEEYRQNKNYPKAIEMCDLGLGVRSSSAEINKALLGTKTDALRKLGLNLQNKGDELSESSESAELEEAIEVYNKAIEIFAEYLEISVDQNRNDSILSETSIAKFEIGKVLFKQEKYRETISHYEQLIDNIKKALGDKSPDFAHWNKLTILKLFIIRSLVKIGLNYEAIYKKAIKISEEAFIDFKKAKDISRNEAEKVSILMYFPTEQCLFGKALFSLDKYEDALNCFTKVKDCEDESLSITKDENQKKAILNTLVPALLGIAGSLSKLGRKEEAKDRYLEGRDRCLEGREILRELLEKAETKERKNDLGRKIIYLTQSLIGILTPLKFIDSKYSDALEKALRENIQNMEDLLKNIEEDNYYIQPYHFILNCDKELLSLGLSEQGKYDEAISISEEILPIYTELLASCTDSSEAVHIKNRLASTYRVLTFAYLKIENYEKARDTILEELNLKYSDNDSNRKLAINLRYIYGKLTEKNKQTEEK